MDLHNYRQQYDTASLTRDELNHDPYIQFESLFSKAKSGGIKEPNAMTLATYDVENGVEARIVLLKEVNREGFIFYTNYDSKKGQQLSNHPSAALLFFWDILECQIRIKGKVEKVDSLKSEKYFASRPHDSKAAAIASSQSEVIEDYAGLLNNFERLKSLKDSELKKPENWGGFILKPTEFEFWQGRPNRMHDRFRYTASQGSWKIDQLFP